MFCVWRLWVGDGLYPVDAPVAWLDSPEELALCQLLIWGVSDVTVETGEHRVVVGKGVISGGDT